MYLTSLLPRLRLEGEMYTVRTLNFSVNNQLLMYFKIQSRCRVISTYLSGQCDSFYYLGNLSLYKAIFTADQYGERFKWNAA